MKFITPRFLLLFLLAGLFSCDEYSLPESDLRSFPAVESLSLQPQQIVFTPADGFRDTTITITISTVILNPEFISEAGYVFRLRNSGIIVRQGTLSPAGSGSSSYNATFSLQTSTTTFEEYQIEVYAFNDRGDGNYASAPLSVSGFSNARPVIESTESPSLIVRPSAGAIPARFTATVSDADGNNTISEVRIRIIDQFAGEVDGSPFLMLDDGFNFGDEVANDHTYTLSFDVTPTANRPDRDFDIEFFALDQGGLYSDTVRTTFSIRNN